MRFINGKKQVFKGLKELPQCALIIITKNNEEELRNLLHELSTQELFQKEMSQIVVIDYYSLDRTLEVVNEFTFANEIKVFKKSAVQALTAYIRPYFSKQMIEIINLAKMDKAKTFLQPKDYNQWLQNFMKVFGAKTTKSLAPDKVIERIEKDRKMVFDILNESVLEPLTHLQMQLMYEKSEYHIEHDAIQSVNKLVMNLQDLMSHFDQELYDQESLFTNLGSYAESFTNKTQIELEIAEKGVEQKLSKVMGLSMMRMIKEALDLVWTHGHATKAFVELRWRKNALYIKVKDNSTTFKQRKVKKANPDLIEERAIILGGDFRMRKDEKKGIDIFIVLPLSDVQVKQDEKKVDDHERK